MRTLSLLLLSACAPPDDGPDTAPEISDTGDLVDDTGEVDEPWSQPGADPGRDDLPASDTAQPDGCQDSEDLSLDVQVSEDMGTTLALGLSLASGAAHRPTVTASWTDAGQDISITRSFDEEATTHQGWLWALPPVKEITLEATWTRSDRPNRTYCSATSTSITTGTVDDSGLPEIVTGSRSPDAQLAHLRFVYVMKLTGGAEVVMRDGSGRVVWRKNLDSNELVKGVAVDPWTPRVLAMLPSDTIDEGARIRSIAPDGSMDTLQTNVALHHGIAMGQEGELVSLGWELYEHQDVTLLYDTLVRVDLDSLEHTELWYSYEWLGLPSDQQLSTMGGSGLYDGDVLAFGYCNGVSYDPDSDMGIPVISQVDPGLVLVPLHDEEAAPTYLTHTGLLGAPGTMGPHAGEPLMDDPHYGWVNSAGDWVVYNRRDATLGTSIDALGLAGETVTYEGSLRFTKEDGSVGYNPHLGTVFPVDRKLGVDGGLVATWHPFDDDTTEVWVDPHSPEGDAASPERVLELRLAEGDSTGMIGGFMEAWTVHALNDGGPSDGGSDSE